MCSFDSSPFSLIGAECAALPSKYKQSYWVYGNTPIIDRAEGMLFLWLTLWHFKSSLELICTSLFSLNHLSLNMGDPGLLHAPVEFVCPEDYFHLELHIPYSC